MKVTPHKILKLVYILIGIFLVLTYTLSLIFKVMIDYIVFPIADIGKEESAKIEELNLVLRKNRDNDKALMKCQHFQEVFPNKVERIVTTDEEGYESITIKYPYDTYSDKALYELLSSSEWQSVSESTLEESPIKE